MFEKKFLSIDAAEIKLATNDAGAHQIEGYASTFGNEDYYGDTILPGAFKETLKSGRKVLMLDSHNSMAAIGKWLALKEDKKGLYARGEFTPGHTRAADVYALLKHGAITGLSIGFRVPKGGAEVDEETDKRTIKQVDLVEVSIVAMPANELAQVTAVKAEIAAAIEGMESKRDAELILREAGFSKSAALAFVSRAFRIARSESEPTVDSEIKRILSTAVTKADLESVIKTL